MNTLVNLLKDHQVGIWCKRGAWIILAIGLVNAGLEFYTTISQFTGDGIQPVPSSLVWTTVRFALEFIPAPLFYFFILYAAGVLVDHFISAPETQEDTGEDEPEDEMIVDQRV
jgi:hypothetical protein